MQSIKFTSSIFTIFFIFYVTFPNNLYGMLRRSGPVAQFQIKRSISHFTPEQRKRISTLFPQKTPIISELIAQVFRTKIIRKNINKVITLNNPCYITKAIFSPNGKMIASGGICEEKGKSFLLWKIDDDNIDINQTPQSVEIIQQPISSLAFSLDNKKIAIGCQGKENNLFVCKINDKGILDKNPQILKGHSDNVNAVTFHPRGKIMVSASVDDNFLNTILLWNIENNGIINETPQMLVNELTDLLEISDLSFSADGTILICGGRGRTKTNNVILLWEFNEDFTLKKLEPKPYDIHGKCFEVKMGKRFIPNDDPKKTPNNFQLFNASKISFIGNSKRFLIEGNAKYGASDVICEITNDNILKCEGAIFSSYLDSELPHGYDKDVLSSSISPDETMAIVSLNSKHPMVLFKIQDADTMTIIRVINSSLESNLSFNSDSNRILSCRNGKIFIRTLLYKNDQKILDDLKKLDIERLLLIEKALNEIIPSTRLKLLNSISPISTPQEYLIKDAEEAVAKELARKAKKQSLQKKSSVPPAFNFEGLVNWAKNFFWSSSKTLTPKE